MQGRQKRVAFASSLVGLLLVLVGLLAPTRPAPAPPARPAPIAGLTQETLDTIELLARVQEVGIENLSPAEKRALLAQARGQGSAASLDTASSANPDFGLRWGER